MKKILLTSAGFENPNIKNKFLELVNKKVEDIKVLFITTAAIEVDAIRVLPKCLDDLTLCGIKEENITVYDMHEKIEQKEINNYDAIYVCGGDTSYLVKRMKEVNFKDTINYYLENGGVYVGVSAGSVAAAGNYKDGLDFIMNVIDVHCDEGSQKGTIENEENIYLTNEQAILLTDSECEIIE